MDINRNLKTPCNIYGICGYKQSGKNTVAKIWQLLDLYQQPDTFTDKSEIDFVKYYLSIKDVHINYKNKWQQKSFAHKLKQIICILTGCTMEQLECEAIKNSKLPEIFQQDGIETYRQFLQFLGTDVFQDKIGKDVWVNALFEDDIKIQNFVNLEDFLLPIPLEETTNRQKEILFQCQCGNIFKSTLWRVENQHTKSCGCYQKLKVSQLSTVHGDSWSRNKVARLLSIYKNMKTRCYNVNSPNYEYYGAKGIGICSQWLDNYISFKNWAISNGYDDTKTIDRINTSLGYSPENCRWISMFEQSLNKEVYKNNKLGIRGVSEKNGKYYSQTQFKGKKIFIGYFDTIEEASVAYENKRKELFNIKEPVERKWLITDVRFKLEADAVTERGGKLIKVIRYKVGDKVWFNDEAEPDEDKNQSGKYEIIGIHSNEEYLISNGTTEMGAWNYEIKHINTDTHASEVEQDSISVHYTIHNSTTLEDLIEQVKYIMVEEGVINE